MLKLTNAPDNQKTSGIKTNPNDPTLTQTSIGFNLKFIHPSTKNEILYEATSSTPAKKTEHFLIFDPATKTATLERLDAAFVFNAGIYAQPYPPLKPEVEDDFEFSADSDTADSEDDTGGVFDFRHFMNRNSAAEDKRQKRLGALKRAGKEIVDIPDDQLPPDGELIIIPDAIQPPQDQDSEMDAPGESDDEMETYASPPPAPKSKAAPKPKAPPKAKAPPKPRAPPKKKAVPAAIPPPTTRVDEIVIPDAAPPPALDTDDEEIDFSDEDEDDPPQQTVATPEAIADEEEVEIDFEDLQKELEEALGSGEDPIMQQGAVVYEDDDDVSDEDEDQPARAPPRPMGGAPKSLAEMYGGNQQEEEDSESEEE